MIAKLLKFKGCIIQFLLLYFIFAKRTKEETITFREIHLGATSITIWKEYAAFISDNKGRIHVWVPDSTIGTSSRFPRMYLIIDYAIFSSPTIYLNAFWLDSII